MTVINPSSISGITSITMPSGDGNVLTIHTNDGVERFRIDSSGNVKVGSACTISQDGDVFFTGVTTATTFTGAHSGSGANLTSLPAAQLTGTLPAISGANLTGIAATDNVRTGILDVAGIATFRNNVNVGTAVTITESGIEATGVGITIANINGNQIGGRRNLIINGAMKVAQRGTSNSGLDGYGSVDRFYPDKNQLDNLQGTQEQVGISDLPGFTKAFKLDITTAETALAADEYFTIGHRIEAQNLQQLAYGTSSAKSMTLSFHVKSSTTGTYVVSCYQADGSRLITATYTINSANTWEKKVITFPGNTGVAIDNNTDQGLQFNFGLAAGSDWTSANTTSWTSYSDAGYLYGQTANLIAQTGTFFLTGVQLEVGSQATAFEHRSFGEEELLCHRYFFSGTANRFWYNGHGGNVTDYQLIPFKTEMRAAPTIAFGTIHTSTNVNTGSGSDSGHFYSDVKASSWQYSPLSAATGNTTGKVDYTASAEL